MAEHGQGRTLYSDVPHLELIELLDAADELDPPVPLEEPEELHLEEHFLPFPSVGLKCLGEAARLFREGLAAGKKKHSRGGGETP